MAEQGSSKGAEGGSGQFSSNKDLLKHYEDQVSITWQLLTFNPFPLRSKVKMA
ncbi:hypothetical protein DPMN_004438 [Dreissena polymorpha]|uniref:Uncharacterized protein n=1 Tax=Dreissena polymorpha TaxID=45954 RepID=A0A9D4MMU0_DREPO|nr:hypothetical protein DPMN_004438 [Dreissena polymorpha]